MLKYIICFCFNTLTALWILNVNLLSVPTLFTVWEDVLS
jgi:hypothetical protein